MVNPVQEERNDGGENNESSTPHNDPRNKSGYVELIQDKVGQIIGKLHRKLEKKGQGVLLKTDVRQLFSISFQKFRSVSCAMFVLSS